MRFCAVERRFGWPQGSTPGHQHAAEPSTQLGRQPHALRLSGGEGFHAAIEPQMSIQLMITPPKAVSMALVCCGNTSSVISVNDSEGAFAYIVGA